MELQTGDGDYSVDDNVHFLNHYFCKNKIKGVKPLFHFSHADEWLRDLATCF